MTTRHKQHKILHPEKEMNNIILIQVFVMIHIMINNFFRKHWFLLLSFLYIVLFTAKAFINNGTVFGDGIFYFSWLRSLVIDHDISFYNEYAHFSVSQLQTSLGYIGNQFAVGPAFYWFPVYAWIHTLIKGNGYSFFYQFGVGLMSVGYVLTGFLLLYRTLQTFFSEYVSKWTVLVVALATNMLFYGSLDTVNSHAVSFFTASVLLALLTEQKKRYLLIGFLSGVMGLIRIQDSAFLFIPLFVLFFSRDSFVQKCRNACITSIGWSIPLFIQFACWYLLYGDIRIPYLERGYGFSLLNSHILDVLFSPQNGVLLWTPVCMLSLAGLIKSVVERKNTSLFVLSAVGLFAFIWQAYIIGSWSIWWQGASFSGRMFIGLYPLLSIGFAGILNRFKQYAPFITMSFSILNVCLILYSLTFVFH